MGHGNGILVISDLGYRICKSLCKDDNIFNTAWWESLGLPGIL